MALSSKCRGEAVDIRLDDQNNLMRKIKERAAPQIRSTVVILLISKNPLLLNIILPSYISYFCLMSEGNEYTRL